MMRDTYINSNLSLSQNSLAAEALSLKISSHEESLKWSQRVSQMITKTVPISTRIIIKYAMKQGIPLWIWWKVNGNWDNNMIRISQWTESHCRTNTSIRRKKQTQKNRTMRSLSWIWVAKLTIWVRSFEFTRSISSTRIG